MGLSHFSIYQLQGYLNKILINIFDEKKAFSQVHILPIGNLTQYGPMYLPGSLASFISSRVNMN